MIQWAIAKVIAVLIVWYIGSQEHPLVNPSDQPRERERTIERYDLPGIFVCTHAMFARSLLITVLMQSEREYMRTRREYGVAGICRSVPYDHVVQIVRDEMLPAFVEYDGSPVLLQVDTCVVYRTRSKDGTVIVEQGFVVRYETNGERGYL
jgi:hypothetical protein